MSVSSYPAAFCPLHHIHNVSKFMFHTYTQVLKELKPDHKTRQKEQKDQNRATEIGDGTKNEAEKTGPEQESSQMTQDGDSDIQEDEEDDRADPDRVECQHPSVKLASHFQP